MSDQAARDAALRIDRHLLLQAPAGSGKTTVLAQRFLAALAEVQEPEEVLAITFTRKAAAEMRERVLVALEGRMPATQADLARWTQLREAVLQQAARCGWLPAELPTRLRIQTIDSLCHEIARAMPLLGRMHQLLDVVDDAGDAYAAAAGETLRLADEEPALQSDADRLLRRLDNDWERALQLLAGLLPGRNRWLPVLLATPPEALGERVAASLLRIVGDSLADMQRSVPKSLLEEGAALARRSVENLLASGRIDAEPPWVQAGAGLSSEASQLAVWQAIASLALKDDGDWRAQVTVVHGFPATEAPLKARWKEWTTALQRLPDIQRRLQRIDALPPVQIDADESETLAALARMLLLCAAQLKLVFRERRVVDHGEVAAVARQALRDMDTPTELSVRQTLRVRHLLVDEFQDTSPDQLDLVRELIQGWDDDVPRSLFLVGDPMQSIYLFRDSEVGLFLQTRTEGVGTIRLESLQLLRNFRAVPSLVEWSNAAFQRIFPRTEDIRSSAVAFLAAEAARDGAADDLPAVTIWPQPDAAVQPEADAIAAEILKLRASQPQWRIAVLVQTRALAPAVLGALRNAAVPVLGVDLAPLAERPVVRDLIALGQALLHGGNRTAWLAVLHAPTCGLTLADLHALCGDDAAGPLIQRLADSESWMAISGDGQQRLRRVAPLLLRAWRGRGRFDLASSVEILWRQLGGWQACRDESERAAALQYLAALRRAGEGENIADGARLQQLAESLRDQGVAAADNPVEVLTIHHAKGLEWDAVFVPGLGRGARSDDPPLLRWLELPAPQAETDLLLAVRSLGEPGASDPLGRYIASLQRERQDNERVRLAYVAATRARQRLYLSGHAAWNHKQQRPVPRHRSLLQILWPAVREVFESAPPPVEQAAPAAQERLSLATPWNRLPADFTAPAQRPPLQIIGATRGAPESGDTLAFDWAGPLARATGTVVHSELERFALYGLPLASELAAAGPGHVARLRESGIDSATAARVGDEIILRLQQMLEDPRARWLLATAHRDARSEWRLSGIVDGELRNAIIDRSFVAEDGCRWVIDFKTSPHAGGGLAQFLESELERYRPQLELYRRLVARTGPEPVRAALYFPWLREFRELDPRASR